jgi:ppGpp synthetase/RelA/SpoT-type nucleotidyltranferase/SAM-dependent methyltransferase
MTRLLLFRKADPGSRGGHGYYDHEGKWQYGDPPTDAARQERRAAFDAMLAEGRVRRARTAAALAPHIAEYQRTGHPVEFERRSGDRLHVAVLSPIPRGEGGHRITQFGPDGPFGHTEHNTLDEAVKELVDDHQLTGEVRPGTVDVWAQQPEWAEGMRRIEETRRLNAQLATTRTGNVALAVRAVRRRRAKAQLMKARTLVDVLSALTKAQQMGFTFQPRKDIEKPGSRGSVRWWRDPQTGRIRYDERPQPETRAPLTVTEAERMGAEAFAQGRPAASALDQAFMARFDVRPAGVSALDVLTAYQRGWSRANAAADVPGVTGPWPISQRVRVQDPKDDAWRTATVTRAPDHPGPPQPEDWVTVRFDDDGNTMTIRATSEGIRIGDGPLPAAPPPAPETHDEMLARNLRELIAGARERLATEEAFLERARTEAADPPDTRVGRYRSGKWWVRQIGSESHFPTLFSTKKEAAAMAERNAAVAIEGAENRAAEAREAIAGYEKRLAAVTPPSPTVTPPRWPEKAKTYADTAEHWEVLEGEFLRDAVGRERRRLEGNIRAYQAAIDEKHARAREYAVFMQDAREQLTHLEAHGLRPQREALLRSQYQRIVKTAISKGKPVPREVIAQSADFRTAMGARARYEKAWRTSFANVSSAVDARMVETRGYKVKRQDGHAIMQDQRDEIAQGVSEVEEALGPLADLFRQTALTIAHTSGKHPFLKTAAGLYQTGEVTISTGIAGLDKRPIPVLAHELGHWLDFEAGRATGVKARRVTGSWGRAKLRASSSVADADFSKAGPGYQLLMDARATINNVREVERTLKLHLNATADLKEKARIERTKVTLGPYWREPAEVWARLVEQFVATRLGRGGVAMHAPEEYHMMPGWWRAADFAPFIPRIEAEAQRRLGMLRGPREAVAAPPPIAKARLLLFTKAAAGPSGPSDEIEAAAARQFTNSRWRWLLLKAEQLAFLFRKPVQRPGIRGGRYFVTPKGEIRYGDRPGPRAPAAPGRPKGRADHVTLDEIRAAMAWAQQKWPTQPNASRLAVLTQPHVYKVWQKLNPGWAIEPAHNDKYGDGFVVYREFAGGRINWNGVKENYFSHSPSVAWDGVRRETYHGFVDALTAMGAGYEDADLNYSEAMRRAYKAGLKVVRSITMPEGFAVGNVIERASGQRVRVEGAEDGDLLVRPLAGGKRERLNPDAVRAGRALRVENPPRVNEQALKLRSLADAMTSTIAAKRDPAIAHQNITARRSNIAAGMHAEARFLEQVQEALRALAAGHERGDLPSVLSGLTTRAQVADLLSKRDAPEPILHATHLRDLLKTSYPDLAAERARLADAQARAGEDLNPRLTAEEIAAAEAVAKRLENDPAVKSYEKLGSQAFYWIKEHRRAAAAGLGTPEQWATARETLRNMLRPPSVSPEDRIRELERKLIGMKFAGYFPTPQAAADAAVASAGIAPGMTVLEPSAGKGDMAEAIRRGAPDAKVKAIEIASSLAEVTRAKGFDTTAGDFLSLRPENLGLFDRVVMNPPFENGQDMEHVRHAYTFVKPGGRLVAIVSEGPFFRNDGNAKSFRQWLDDVHGTAERLPEGSFKHHETSDRVTGVNARLVTITKAATVLSKARLLLFKAVEQLGFSFTPRKPVQRPGSRGGRFYLTRRAHVRYGERPVPAVREITPGRGPRLTVRLREQRDIRFRGEQVRDAADVAAAFRAMTDLDRERLWSVALDAEDKILAIECVSIGSIDASVATAREALKGPMLLGARSVWLVHNHPSSHPKPSHADIQVHKHSARAVAMVAGADGRVWSHGVEEWTSTAWQTVEKSGVNFLDTIIVEGEHHYRSIREGAGFQKGARLAHLATAKAQVEKDLHYLETEDLPALEARADADAVVAKAALCRQRGALLGQLTAVDHALTRERYRLAVRQLSRADRALLKAQRKLHGRRWVDGLHVSIENRRGSVRHWRDHDGTDGRTKMRSPYGYLRGTVGADNDQVDTFLGPHARSEEVANYPVYIVTTQKPPDFSQVDEQKVMVGYPSQAAARTDFLHHYGGEERYIGQIDVLSWEDFKRDVRYTRYGAPFVRGEVVERAATKARLLFFSKAHVRAYQRTTQAGERVDVPEHEDRRPSAVPKAPGAPRAGAALPPPGRTPGQAAAPKGMQGHADTGDGEQGAAQAQPLRATDISHEELAEHVASYHPILTKAVDQLATLLPGLPVGGRLKETASLAEKLQRKGKPIEEIEDIAGARVTFGSIEEQRAAVERVRRTFQVRTEDDYLTQPKAGYRSYHLTVEVDGRPVEIQLRTQNQTTWADWNHDLLYKVAGTPLPAEVSNYSAQMAEFFACLDGGGSREVCGPEPDCPPAVRQLTAGCMSPAAA